MRTVIIALATSISACASAAIDSGRESIEVYHSATLNYVIEDGGRARVMNSSGAHPVYEFEASRADFQEVAQLLAPLQAEGLPCSEPSQHIAPGNIIWRRDGEEVRRVEIHTICYADGRRPLASNTDRAWRWMEEIGHERYVAPAIPEPTIITLQNMYWGRATATWTIPRGGIGRYVDPRRAVDFEVSAELFDRLREIFQPYEERDFHCNRVIADGPYGYVIWSSREGQEDQRTQWDAGCVTGDASDLFERIDSATAILAPLRDSASP